MMVIEKKPETLNNTLLILRDNRYFLISFFVLLFGMLSGALSVGYLGDTYVSFIENYFDSFIAFRTSAGFFKIFFSLFLSSLGYIAVIMFSSFGVIGIAVVPLTVFFRGFGTTVLSGILYRNFSLQGIAFANLILLPSGLIMNLVIVYLSGKCFELAFKFAALLKDVSSRGITFRPTCMYVFKKSIVCVIVSIFVSAAEAVFSVGFIRFFQF